MAGWGRGLGCRVWGRGGGGGGRSGVLLVGVLPETVLLRKVNTAGQSGPLCLCLARAGFSQGMQGTVLDPEEKNRVLSVT